MTAYDSHTVSTPRVTLGGRRGTLHSMTFDSVQAAVDVCRDADSIKAGKTPEPQIKRALDQLGDGEGWTGLPAGYTFDKLLQLLDEGWQEGASRVQSLDVPVPPARDIRRRVQWREQGDFVDLQRVWGGRLESAWQSARRQKVPALTVKTLCVDIGANCNVPASVLFWRGAAVLCLSDVLTRAGYNVEIIATQAAKCVYTNGDHFAASITVKPATAPLELNSLASVVCCAGFFRGVIFDLMMLNPHSCAETCLGQTVATSEAGIEPAHAVGGTASIRDLESARAWVLKSLAGMGVEIEGGQ